MSARNQTRMHRDRDHEEGGEEIEALPALRTPPYRNQRTAATTPPRMERRSHHFCGRFASGTSFETLLELIHGHQGGLELVEVLG